MRDSQGRQCMVAPSAGSLGPPFEPRLMDEWKVQIHCTQKTSARKTPEAKLLTQTLRY